LGTKAQSQHEFDLSD
jgi:HrpA-like RNA helicase